MAPHVLKASGGEAHWRTNSEQSSGPYGMDCYDGVHFCDGPVSATRPWTAEDWRWLADELDAWYAGRGIEHLDGSEQRRIAELIESGEAVGTHFLDPDCWYEDRLEDCTSRAPSSSPGSPQATRTVNPTSKLDPQPQGRGEPGLNSVSDVDGLGRAGWSSIATNFGECAFDPWACPGPLSGEAIWTADDLRVLARANELIADAEEERDPERASYFRVRAERFYTWADDVEAGTRPRPSPQPQP